MQRCGNSKCGVLVRHEVGSGKWYCSNKCRQAAYRARKTKAEKVAQKVYQVRCVNCGRIFDTTREMQRFHNTSCRVSFHQQQKRLNNQESIEA